MRDKYIIDDALRYLPWGSLMALLIWGTLIGQLTWQAKQLKTINVELINLPSQTSQIIIPKPPVRKVIRQQSSTERQSSKHSPSQTQSPAMSLPAASLSETNLPATNKATSDYILAGPSIRLRFENHGKIPTEDSKGPVIPPQFGAAYLNNPKPEYPAFARRMRIEGMVMLKVLVSRQGIALKVEMAQSSGYEILDKAAAGAVKNWRFVPARQGDSPVEEWVQVPVAFHLQR